MNVLKNMFLKNKILRIRNVKSFLYEISMTETKMIYDFLAEKINIYFNVTLLKSQN